MSSKKSTVFSAQKAKSFILRFPPGMRGQIAESASKHRRAMCADIITRIHSSLIQDGTLLAASDERPDTLELSARELRMLDDFRRLTTEQQEALISLLER